MKTLLFCLFFSLAAHAEVPEVRWEQKQGAEIPLNLEFQDENGARVLLGDVVSKQVPTVLVLAYYGCPNLCTLVMNSLTDVARGMEIGRDFKIVSVSIDPAEKPSLALAKQRTYLARFGLDPSHRQLDWKFLVADPEAPGAARSLADAVGFHYAYDAASKQYSHPSGIAVLSPDGRVSQYLMGIQFTRADFTQALGLARAKRSGGLVSDLILLCAHYNPFTSAHTRAALLMIQALSAAFLLAAGLFFVRIKKVGDS